MQRKWSSEAIPKAASSPKVISNYKERLPLQRRHLRRWRLRLGPVMHVLGRALVQD